MKTAKEKAEELVEKFMPYIAGADRYNSTLGLYDKDISKQCALITVDEQIELIIWLNLMCIFNNPVKEYINIKLEELKKLKKEIELL